MTRYGGIDLGGTKIQAVVADEHHEVARRLAPPDPDLGRPGRGRLAIVGALRDAAREAGVTTGAHGRRARVARRRRRRRGHGHERAQPARLGGHVPAAREAGGRRSARPSRSATTSTSPRTPSSTSARASRTARCSASSGAPASAAGSCWTASSGRAAARPARSATCASRRRRACPCGRRGCMEAYAGRGAMETYAREKVEKGAKTALFELMEENGQDAPGERHLGPRARAGRQARAPAHRPRGARPRRGRRLRGQPPGRRGGHRRRRARPPARRALRGADPRPMMPHLFADHRPPVVLLAALGDLGGAIGASLLGATRVPAPA